jgi:hypothetical protein
LLKKYRELCRSSPGRSQVLHVCSQRLLDQLLESLLLLFGLLHQLLRHLLEGLLLLLGQLHPLLGGLLEGLLPLLRLLSHGQVQSIEELHVRTHGLLHHLLKGFLLPLDLSAHSLHSGDPPPRKLGSRLLFPVRAVGHLRLLDIYVTKYPYSRRKGPENHQLDASERT